MTFEKLNHNRTLITGSLESDTGSQYLFGYDQAKGLQWLERTGVEYTPEDREWEEAQVFISRHLSGAPVQGPVEPILVRMDTDELRPRTVSRSVAANGYDEMGQPEENHDYESDDQGIDFGDDDISAQAEAFLSGSGLGNDGRE